VAEGFISIEEIVETPVDELARIDGFDADVAAELQNRANTWLETKRKELEDKRQELGIQDDLMEFEGLKPEMILKLAENGVKSKDDLADLAGDELREILGGDALTTKEADDMIMRARAHWFENENDNGLEGNASAASAS
ncbi:MAG: transcription termination/antitermination protein NusA, partial [Micavibrio aeruginosavorus]|nr:transcription termination/antitermination protein NusA [Micavibrio aeruginosavorus]